MSNVDYITKTGKVYCDYGNNMFFPKKHIYNKTCGYLYINIRFKDNKIRSRRLHVILAKMFIDNPNPKIYNIVGHKNNIKTDCRLENLYWTTNQENTQKAVNDGLNYYSKAQDNVNSIFVKVLDKNTHKIIGVYGSMRECERCIDNIDIAFLAKILQNNKPYKPRSKKYIYLKSSLDEFNKYSDIQNIILYENPKVNKKPKIFIMKNKSLGIETILDNQKEAERITGIPQATISHLIKERNGINEYNGWSFKCIGEKEYTESSGYQKMVDMHDIVVIQNIYTNEIKKFNTTTEAQTFLGLNGHDFQRYSQTGNIIQSQWKFLGYEKKEKSNDSISQNAS